MKKDKRLQFDRRATALSMAISFHDGQDFEDVNGFEVADTAEIFEKFLKTGISLHPVKEGSASVHEDLQGRGSPAQVA